MFNSENLQDGVTFYATRFSVGDKDYLSILYRVTKWVDDADSVVKPFLAARKGITKKELDNFENFLTEDSHEAIEYVERYRNALDAYARCGFLTKLLFGQPKPPPQEIMDEFKKVEERRAELNSRTHNPFLDLQRQDGEAMLRDIISGLQSKGFEILSDTRKSNGEVDQQTIVLQKNIATIEVKPENSTMN